MNGSNQTKQLLAIAVLIGLMAGLFYQVATTGQKWKEQAKQAEKEKQSEKTLPHIEQEPDETREEGQHFGYAPNPKKTREFVASLPKPFLTQAGPDLKSDNETPVFLYRSLYKAYKYKTGQDWEVGRQGIGDCVSWGFKHAVEIHSAVLWETGESSDWQEVASESIYGGSRVEAMGVSFGGYSDGSYGAAAAKWLHDWGVVYRQNYEGLVDLRQYSASRAKAWGAYGNGGKGDGGKLDAIAKQSPVRSVVLIRNFNEAASAISAGYPVAVCSGQGFSSSRDKDGFCRAQGSWAHCMVFIGVRFAPRPGLLCLNSWGPDASNGPKFPDDQPDGSFWVEARVCDSMLRGEDSFSVSGFDGFPFRDLRNGDWVNVQKSERILVNAESGSASLAEFGIAL